MESVLLLMNVDVVVVVVVVLRRWTMVQMIFA
jgi:hypothetical protein